MNAIPLVDLSVQHRQVADEVTAGFAAVLSTGDFIGGKAVTGFEQEYADVVGARWCVGVGNGTDALEMALRAVGVGHGDEVVLPANTFIATAEAVLRRYQGSHEAGKRREQVLFPLTHEALARVVSDLAAAQ